MSTCKIELDNYQSEYFPGDVIEGRIISIFSQLEGNQSVRVKLVGAEHAYSRRLRGSALQGVDSTEMNIFYSTQQFLAVEGEFSPNEYEFTFAFQLPKDIPGTYDHSAGWIKYFVKAAVLKANFSGCEDSKEINVMAPLDFNTIKGSPEMKPISRSIGKFDPSFCCFNGGPVVMDVYLPRGAFAQGESAEIVVDLNNMTNENVWMVSLKILQVIEIRSSRQEVLIKDDKLLFSEQQEGFPAKSDRTYRFNIQIPKDPVVPHFNLCKIFSEKCCVKVVAELPSLDLKISIPIVIGQIPVQAVEHRASPVPTRVSPLLEQNYLTNEETSNLQGDVLQRTLGQNDFSVPTTSPPQTRRIAIRDVPSPATALYPPNLPNQSTPLLPSRGPAPYSSYKQRPFGFTVPKPLKYTKKLPAPKPVDGPVPVPTANSAEPYPPVAGPSMPLPEEMAAESPPSYDSLYGKSKKTANVHRISSKPTSNYEIFLPPSTSQSSNDIALVSEFIPHPSEVNTTANEASLTPSAPVSPTPTELYPPSASSTAFPLPRPASSGLYPPKSTPSNFPPMPLPSFAPYPPENPTSVSSSAFPSMPLPTSVLYPPENPTFPPMPLPSSSVYPPPITSTGFLPMPIPRSSPYPLENAAARWNFVRSTIPAVAASHRMPSTTSVSSSTPYPPENTPPRDNSVGFAHYAPSCHSSIFPMPSVSIPSTQSDGLYPPPMDEASQARSSAPSSFAPYPKESSPPKCGKIGFAVVEEAE